MPFDTVISVKIKIHFKYRKQLRYYRKQEIAVSLPRNDGNTVDVSCARITTARREPTASVRKREERAARGHSTALNARPTRKAGESRRVCLGTCRDRWERRVELDTGSVLEKKLVARRRRFS